MPSTQCCVHNCRKRRKRKTRELNRSDSEGSEDDESEKKRQFRRTFHSFPENKVRKDEWVTNMPHTNKDWYPTDNSRICSDHFLEKFIDRNADAKNVTLKPDAQPTRFKRINKAKMRKYIKKTRTRWNVINMRGAMNAVLYKNIGFTTASDLFGVPRSTLIRYIEKFKAENQTEPSTEDYPTNSEVTPRSKSASSPSTPSTKLQKKSEREKALLESILMANQPSEVCSEKPKKQKVQVAPIESAPSQATPKQKTAAKSTQVASQAKILKPLQKSTLVPACAQASPRQITVAQPTTAKTSQSQKKRLLVVSNHQQSVMSSLASLWKSGKFCDAGLGNGSTTVKVHKVVLSAVCPKLLSMFSEDIVSQKFLQVNFPQEVTKEALMAFGEYIYRGVLYLDNNILGQMKIIAKRLDNKELGKLCDRHLQYNKTEPTASLTNFPSTPMTIPAKTTSITSFASTVSPSSASSINAPVVNTKQEISRKKTDFVTGQKVKVITLAPNWSGIATGGDVSSSIKPKLVGSEDDEYGVLSITGHNQCFVSNTSSNTEVASSSIESASSLMEECTIPFSEGADVEYTKSKDPDSYKTPDLNPVSSVAEKVCSKSSPVNIDSSEPLSKSSDLTSLVDNSLTDDIKVYPVELSTTGGDIQPLQTLQTVHVKPELYEMDLT